MIERSIFMAIKNLTIRIDNELLNKLHVISAYENRSANAQVIQLIQKAVEIFETKEGEIKFNENQ